MLTYFEYNEIHFVNTCREIVMIFDICFYWSSTLILKNVTQVLVGIVSRMPQIRQTMLTHHDMFTYVNSGLNWMTELSWLLNSGALALQGSAAAQWRARLSVCRALVRLSSARICYASLMRDAVWCWRCAQLAHFRGGSRSHWDLSSCHDGAEATFEKSSSTGKKMAMAAEYYTDGLSSYLLRYIAIAAIRACLFSFCAAFLHYR